MHKRSLKFEGEWRTKSLMTEQRRMNFFGSNIFSPKPRPDLRTAFKVANVGISTRIRISILRIKGGLESRIEFRAAYDKGRSPSLPSFSLPSDTHLYKAL